MTVQEVPEQVQDGVPGFVTVTGVQVDVVEQFEAVQDLVCVVEPLQLVPPQEGVGLVQDRVPVWVPALPSFV